MDRPVRQVARRSRRRAVPLLALLVATACAADESDAGSGAAIADSERTLGEGDTATAQLDGDDDEGPAPAPSDSDDRSEDDVDVPAERAFPDRPLGDVCPDRIVVQLADLPSVEHGALVRLFARIPTFDAATSGFSAPIQRTDGSIDDVELVLRSGGPAIGFRPAVDSLDDDAVLVAEATTADVARLGGDAVAVVALTDRSHAAIMWDPETYPEVESIAGLGDASIEVLHVTGDPLVEWLVANGVLVESQLTPGFDGEPAAFVATGGTIAQQSDVLIDPFLYSDLPQWGRAIAVAPAADEGWDSYDDLLVASFDRRPEIDQCLGTFVPLVQEALAAQILDPSPAVDTVLAQMRAEVNPFTLLDPGVLSDARAIAVDTGVLTAGGTGRPVGAIDLDRLDDVADELVDVLEVDPPGAPLATNALIDPSITG